LNLNFSNSSQILPVTDVRLNPSLWICSHTILVLLSYNLIAYIYWKLSAIEPQLLHVFLVVAFPE
jgi:hypothetical protein